MRAGFRLGGVEIELRVPEGALEQVVTRRWAAFLGTTEDPVCSVLIKATRPTAADPWDGPVVERLGSSRVVLRHRQMRGEIDLSGDGQVELGPGAETLDVFLKLVFSFLTPSTAAVLLDASGAISGGRSHLFVDANGGPVPAAVERLEESRPVLSPCAVVLYRPDGCWWAGSTPFGAGVDGWPARAAPLEGVWTWTVGSQLEVRPLERLGSLRAVMDNAVQACPDDSLRTAVFGLAADVAGSVPSASITVPPGESPWDEIDAVGRALRFRQVLAGLDEPGMQAYAAPVPTPLEPSQELSPKPTAGPGGPQRPRP